MKVRLLIGLVILAVLLTATVVAGTQWIKIDGTITAQKPQVFIAANDSTSFHMNIHIPSFQVDEMEAEGEIWQTITFDQASIHSYPGEPQLPVISRWIAIPQGANATVKVTANNQRTLEDINHYPAQAPAPECEGYEEVYFEADGTIYSSGSPFPGALYEVEDPVVIRGLRMVKINLYPVQLIPAEKKAYLFADLEVNVEFSGSKGYFFNDRRGRSYQKIYNIAANNMAFASEPLPTLQGDSDNGAEFVILCPPSMEDAALDLADWKILQGYDTEVYTTDDSGTSISAIKAWVQNAYDTWDPAPEFILFFGDAEFISPTYDGTASDLYYVTVDGGDEWADIAHGRISVDTPAEAQKRVNDIINYERYPITNPSYYTNAWHAAYFQHMSGGEAQRRFTRTSEEMYQWFNNVMDDSPFTSNRIYVTGSSVDPKYWNQSTYNWAPAWWDQTGYDEYNIPPELLRTNGFAWDGDHEDITNAVNNGTAFVTHRDHGGETSWGDPEFLLSHVQALTNGDKLPVLWSINCLTGYFDNETGGGGHSICFTEGWERNPNGGAVGILASTRVSYSGRNDRLVWGWLDSMWPEFEPEWPVGSPNDPEWRMGIVLTYGKLYMDHHYSTDPYRLTAIEEFHWFGDPTMEMWAGVPGDMTISHNPILPMGATSFDVSVDVDGALVALVQEGVILGKAYSSGGSAHVEFDGAITSTEDVHLTITRRQYYPYEADLVVGATQDGVVSLDKSVYIETDTIEVSVSDADLIGQGTYVLHIDSDTEPAGEDVTCTEFMTTGTFFGEIDVTVAAPGDANGILSIGDGDTITVYYTDAWTGSMGPVEKEDTAYADVAPPTFAGAANAVGGDHKVTVSWAAATDLTPPISYQIYRAEDSGGQNFSSPLAETNDLEFVDLGLPNMDTFFYVVRATDSFDHQESNTNEVYAMTIGPVLIWEEDFDDKSGIPGSWTVVDGGATGYTWSDNNPGNRSNANWNGIFVIADSDDAGSGIVWNDSLITESINCSGYNDIFLNFTHYFNYISGYGDDHAIIDVSNDGGSTWHNVVDWTGSDRSGVEEVDVSTWADDQSDVKFRFTYTGEYDYYWGIDNLELIGIMQNDPPVISDFAADTTSGPAPLEVNFTATVAGLIASYTWDFGDGETSHGSSPTHTYDEIGVYTVTLNLEGPHGSDELVKTDYITVVCPAPDVDFEADVTEGDVPLTVSFSDLSSAYAGCDPISLEWDFGDGDTSTDANPSNEYDAPGMYTVALTYYTNYSDGEFTETKAGYITVECGAPVADFEADVTEGPAPLTVQFTDLSTAATSCEISNWQYGYGQTLEDMTLVNEQNPEITFEEPGVYHIALRVTNAGGSSDEVKTEYITVTEAADDDVTDDDVADDDVADDDVTDDDLGDDDLADDDSTGDDDDDDDGCGL